MTEKSPTEKGSTENGPTKKGLLEKVGRRKVLPPKGPVGEENTAKPLPRAFHGSNTM